MHTSNYSFCGLLHGLECIESDVENMADDTKLFSIAEEGCLRVSSHIRQVVLSQIPQRLVLLKRLKGNRNKSSFKHRVGTSLASPSTKGGDEGVSSASLKGKTKKIILCNN